MMKQRTSLNRLGIIHRGVPIPPNVKPLGGQVRVYPWEDLQIGDCAEFDISIAGARNRIIISLRNYRAKNPAKDFSYRLSEIVNRNATKLEVWRIK